MFKRLLLFSFMGTSTFAGLAQSNTVSTGGNANGTGGSVSFSVGQVDYTNQSGSGGSINQGVQQPYEIFQTNGLQDLLSTIGFNVFPNPTTDQIFLESTSSNIDGINYQLFDAAGKAITLVYTLSESNSIDMVNLPTGSYNLVIRNGESIIQTYKIIKNN